MRARVRVASVAGFLVLGAGAAGWGQPGETAHAAVTSHVAGTTALSEEERVAIATAVEGRIQGYAEAARRHDAAFFSGFWADVDGFVIAADGNLIEHPQWAKQLQATLAAGDEVREIEFFDGHTYVLARDAAVHTTGFRWTVAAKDGAVLRAHGSWSYVFRNFGGTWKVVHSAGTHLFDKGDATEAPRR